MTNATSGTQSHSLGFAIEHLRARWGEIVAFGGLLIVLGLLTRIVAFVLSGFMAVGYLMAHLPNGFFPVLNFGEAAALYSFAFLYLAAAGPGPWSVDRG